jgi:hypothetical protein
MILKRVATKGAAVAIAVLAGCSSEPSKITGDTACKGTAEAAITSGTTPVISWQPVCTIGTLQVGDLGGNITWLVTDSGSGSPPLNALRSGITYGSVPPEGQQSLLGLSPLQAGISYLLVLRVLDDQGGSHLVDTLTFVP